MPEDEKKAMIEALLVEPVLARLATANPKTLQPHVVPVWFIWDGQSIWISSFTGTRKARELNANPKCSILIEPAHTGSKLQAVLLEGAAELIHAPRDLVEKTATQIYTHYLGPEGVKAPDPQSWIRDPENMLIKLTPRRIYSW